MDNNGSRPPDGQQNPFPHSEQEWEAYDGTPPPESYGMDDDKGSGSPPSGVGGLIFGVAAILMSFLAAVMLNGVSDRSINPTVFYIGVVVSNLAIVLAIIGTVMSVNARKTLPPSRRGPAMAGLAVGVVAICITSVFALICDCAACGVSAAGELLTLNW